MLGRILNKEQRESFGLFQLIKVKTESSGGDVHLGNKTQKKKKYTSLLW